MLPRTSHLIPASLLATLSLLPACGGDDGGDDIPVLTEADHADLDAWKAALVKTCSVDDALPRIAAIIQEESPIDEVPAPRFVDGQALMTATGGTALLHTAAGQLVGLGTPTTPSGTSNQIRAVERTVDGERRGLRLEAVRDGGDCTLLVDGEAVYRTTVYAGVPVALHADAAAISGAFAAQPDVTYPYYSTVDDGDGSTGGIGMQPLLDPVHAALAPSARAHAALVSLLAVSADDAAAFFPLDPGPALPAVLHLAGATGTPPFQLGAVDSTMLLGDNVVLGPLFQGGDATLTIEWSFAPPSFAVDGYHDDEAGLVRIATTLRLTGTQGQNNDPLLRRTRPTLTAVTVAPPRPRSDADAATCLRDRMRLGAPFWSGSYAPSYAVAATPCAELATTPFTQLLADDAALRALVVDHALGLGVDATFRYQGWDDAVIGIAGSLARRDLDVRGALTPAGGGLHAELDAALDRVDVIDAHLDGPGLRAGYQGDVLALSLRWMFAADDTSGVDLDAVGAAIAAVGEVATGSVRAMLDDLAFDPGAGSDGMAAARCGAGLTGGRRDRTLAVLDRAAQHNALAQWRDDAAATVLQVCWDDADLTGLDGALTAAIAFAADDEARATTADVLFADDLAALLVDGVEQRWSAEAYAALGAIATYGAASSTYSFCDQHGAWTSRARCMSSTGFDFFVGASGMLAPSYGDRYGQLAERLTAITEAWMGGNYFDVRYPVELAFFDGSGGRPMWARCDDATFTTRSQRLATLLDQYRAATGFDGRQQVLGQIDDLVVDCQ